MSKQSELHDYIARVRRTLRLRASLRGVFLLLAVALLYTVLAVLLLNHYAFPHGGVLQARSYLIALLVAVVGLLIAWPLARLTGSQAVREAEALHPQLEDRLTTFQQRDRDSDPFLELLAADTLTKTADAPPSTLAPASLLAAFAGGGIVCLGLLLWMIFAGHGYMGYGASLLWTGEKKSEVPLYALIVAPGNVAVRRKSDQIVTASLTNLHPDKVQIFAHFSRSDNGWEPVAMQAVRSATGNAAYQFTFAGLPEDVEYYVTAGPLTSPHYKVRVVDLPFVKSVKVLYRYPKWTGLNAQAEEHGGDLRAIEGTEAQLEVEMDRPLEDGNLTLDDGKVVHLTPTANNRYTGTIAMAKDGAYHVAATSDGQSVRLSEDYFIATDKAEPPQIAIDHPGQDYRASPIEEVTVGVKGNAPFGLRDMHLHYSVNGGPDKDISLLKQPGATSANGKYTLPLEDFKLKPGDIVALYATAKDGHTETKTDISFIQADPFEREFSQSQQGGGGGGGGGGQGNQTEISKREKELIAQTWKQINDKGATDKSARTQGDFLSGAQSKLRDQVMALSARINSRDLSDANEEFSGFEKDMQEAANNMLPASEKLSQIKWQDALQSEQKALQALLRAEATFRQIQVAFGQQGGGGGGGSGTGRDLASLFDLELDTEKNQYETARSSSPQEEHAKEVEDALAKLDALAKRQDEIANQQQKDPAQAFQQRWQQEMLRREAEQLQRQMEQLAKDKGQQGQSGQQGQQGQQGQSGQIGQNGQSRDQQSASSSSGSSGGQGGSQQGQQASSRNQQGKQGTQQSSDQRIEQALSRMKAANDAMKRSSSSHGSTESAKEAAQRLREATGLLGSAQQNIADSRMNSLSREADRIQQEHRAQAGRIDKYARDTQSRSFDPATLQAKIRERNQLSADRQELSNSLSKLQKDMRTAAQGMAGAQPDAAKKLRDALSEMDQSDLDNHMQRTADWLRTGINPSSNGTEQGIADGLGKLSQELHAVQSSLGNGKPGQRDAGGKGEQTAALGQVERLRSQLQAMQAERTGTNRQSNGQQARSGEQKGQGQQQGRQGQGQGQQGNGQQGQQAGNAASRDGRPQGNGQGGGALARGNNDGAGGDARSGDIAGRVGGGSYRGGTAWGNVNTGNNTYAAGSPAQAKGTADNPADTERTFSQSMRELQALRGMVKDDPQATKEIADLQKQMEGLDPRRFPGNPALVEQMHGDVLRAVDRLELRLQRSSDTTDARIGKPDPAPAGYSDAVADYYRRLSKAR